MSDDRSYRQKRGRRGALLVLFGLDMTGYDASNALSLTRGTVAEAYPDVDDHWDLVEWRVEGVSGDQEEVDEHVQAVSSKWSIDRMGIVDRNLLRIGVWEVSESEIPPIVTINACVELAKDYGSESTPGFVNGLLDEFCSREGIEVA